MCGTSSDCTCMMMSDPSPAASIQVLSSRSLAQTAWVRFLRSRNGSFSQLGNWVMFLNSILASTYSIDRYNPSRICLTSDSQ